MDVFAAVVDEDADEGTDEEVFVVVAAAAAGLLESQSSSTCHMRARPAPAKTRPLAIRQANGASPVRGGSSKDRASDTGKEEEEWEEEREEEVTFQECRAAARVPGVETNTLLGSFLQSCCRATYTFLTSISSMGAAGNTCIPSTRIFSAQSVNGTRPSPLAVMPSTGDCGCSNRFATSEVPSRETDLSCAGRDSGSCPPGARRGGARVPPMEGAGVEINKLVAAGEVIEEGDEEGVVEEGVETAVGEEDVEEDDDDDDDSAVG